MKFIIPSFIAISCIMLLGCSKRFDKLANIQVPIDHTWECQINGVQYKGTIDTSIAEYPSRDTLLYCTGTSADKKANVYFRILINRKAWGSSSFSTGLVTATFTFDTSTTNLYRASSTTPARITFHIDTLIKDKLKASFSGTIQSESTSGTITLNVTNGRFNCQFGKGSNEPKFFTFSEDGVARQGFVRSASLITNTLVVDGLPYSVNADQKLSLMIRTGGTIKPGTYRSQDGDAALTYFSPNYYPIYIIDDQGSVTVHIDRVTANIVEGRFTGANGDGKQVSNGMFRCRVLNYQPQSDAAYKWKFAIADGMLRYLMYGGNILNATKSQVGNRYLLTINGDSDHGDAQVKIVLSSNAPVTTGIYESGYSVSKQVDSITFTSPQKTWIGNTTHIFADPSGLTYCAIDTIDAQKVVGRLYGRVRVPLNGGSYTSAEMKKGSFSAAF